MKDGKFCVLGIESSCDESAAAVVLEGRTLLSNIISSQVPVHQLYGGVVPEIASRHHLKNTHGVIREALASAGVTMDEVDLIGVTNGPGLVGSLVIGVAEAKALAYAANTPLLGVHHLQGHISANYLSHPDLAPPFLALVISGGHTDIVDVKDYNDFEVLGATRDDAAGEAYDKVARVLGLGYPGGPRIDAVAKQGDPAAVDFKRVMLEKDSLDFSFSGTKTGVLNYLNTERSKGAEISVPDVAASFQAAVVDVIVTKCTMALARTGRTTLAMAGGVAANSSLRAALQQACRQAGVRLCYPEPVLCTDNGAMLAAAAYYRYMGGFRSDLHLDAHACMAL